MRSWRCEISACISHSFLSLLPRIEKKERRGRGGEKKKKKKGRGRKRGVIGGEKRSVKLIL